MAIAEPLKEIRDLVETAIRETTLEHHDETEHVDWDRTVCCECGSLSLITCSTTDSVFCRDCDQEVDAWPWREFVTEAVYNQAARSRRRDGELVTQETFSIAQLENAIAQHLELHDDASEDRALEVWSQAKAIKSAVLDALDLVTGEGGSVDEWLRAQGVGYQLDLGDGRHLKLAKPQPDYKLRRSIRETFRDVAIGLGVDPQGMDELAECLSTGAFKPAETAKRLLLADRSEGQPVTKEEIYAMRDRYFTSKKAKKPTEGGKAKSVRRPTVIDPKFLEAS